MYVYDKLVQFCSNRPKLNRHPFNHPTVLSDVNKFTNDGFDARIRNAATGQFLNIKNPNTNPFIPTPQYLSSLNVSTGLLPDYQHRNNGQIKYFISPDEFSASLSR